MSKISWKPGTMLFPAPPIMVTCGTMEKANVLTIAWSGIINTEPPMTYISVRPSRYSHDIIKNSGEFVINIANLPLSKSCDFCGVKSGRNTDKIKEQNLALEPAKTVKVPMLKDAPVSLECKVKEIKSFGTHDMFIAEIVNVDIDDKYVEEDGRLAVEKMGILAFAHGRYYTLGRDLGGFGFSVDKTKENKTKPRKSKFMEILKIEEQIKDGTLKIKDKKPSLQEAIDKKQNSNKKNFGKSGFNKRTPWNRNSRFKNIAKDEDNKPSDFKKSNNSGAKKLSGIKNNHKQGAKKVSNFKKDNKNAVNKPSLVKKKKTTFSKKEK